MAARAPAKRPRTRLAPDARRVQFLDGAAVVFRGRAYADVSLDEVAQAAGVARGLINHHFGTKRGLYVEVVREAMRAPGRFPSWSARGRAPWS